jgi:hypothetical protein
MEPNQYSTLVRIMLDYLAQPLERDSGTKLCQDKTYRCVDRRNRHQPRISRQECAQHLYCIHNICFAVPYASRRHHRRSAPAPAARSCPKSCERLRARDRSTMVILIFLSYSAKALGRDANEDGT